MPKVMSAEEAVRTYIHDGATVAFGGFVGAMVPEEVNKTIQELYLSSCSPKGLTAITPPARATRVSGASTIWVRRGCSAGSLAAIGAWCPGSRS